MRIALPVRLDIQSAGLREQIEKLPRTPGIYIIHASNQPVHLACTSNLPRRLFRLLSSSYVGADGRTALIAARFSAVECWPTGSKLESQLTLYQVAKTYFPSDYPRRLRLRMPWYVSWTTKDFFPRLMIVNRIPLNSAAFGPFRTRDLAHNYMHDVLGLSQLRRCAEALTPSPQHPGCIYGEMSQCLKPCQGLASEEDYGKEVSRIAHLLETNGRKEVDRLSLDRDRAAEATEFERAAQLHRLIERIKSTTGTRDDVITDVRTFNGVAVTTDPTGSGARLWPMIAARWQDPIPIVLNSENHDGKRYNQELLEPLVHLTAHPNRAGKRSEHLALFARWYYSSWREGEWFSFKTPETLAYRRVLQSISRAQRSSKPECRAPPL